nr:uncharacterized protein LOC131779846 [Pocillopora verrucosa]
MEMNGNSTNIYLFNCDNTCSLDPIESLLLTVQNDVKMRFAVGKRIFRLREMSDMCETIIPELQMDYAIFAVHAQESRLSINEDNAGIGFARIYRALLKATGNKVLIVIGGDDNYRDEDEEEHVVISRWARRKVASQFDEEYLDGRKSFIFSWNKGHREIHEKALEHYLDPSKKERKFQYVPKQEPTTFPLTVNDSLDKDGISGDDVPPLGGGTQRRLTGQEGEKSLGPRPEPIDSRPEFLEGTELLDTLVRFGKISFKKEDVRVWDRRWKPSGTTVRHLSRDWMFIPLANVRFVAMANGGISYSVQPQSICSWASVLCCLKLVWDCLAWIYSCILWILIAVCEWLGKKIDG